MFKLTKKKVAAGALAAGLVAMTGVGYAYWTTSGSGTGSGTTGSDTAVTFDQTSDPTDLILGGPSQNIDFDITNPGDGPEYVTDVTVGVDPTMDEQADPLKPACTADDFTVTFSWTAHEIAAGDTESYTATITLDDDVAANQDNCKGVTVPLVYAAS